MSEATAIPEVDSKEFGEIILRAGKGLVEQAVGTMYVEPDRARLRFIIVRCAYLSVAPTDYTLDKCIEKAVRLDVTDSMLNAFGRMISQHRSYRQWPQSAEG